METLEIKILSVGDKFPRWGQEWKILEREGDTLLIEQTTPSQSLKRYTVAIVQRYKEDKIFQSGKSYPAGNEYLPGETSYGRLAWQFISYDLAKDFFNSFK